MSNKRRLIRKYEPGDNPGFLGEGHIARALIQGDFRDTDPFILLMDDMLDKKTTEPVGGPHPHAGFETVTLMLEGEFQDISVDHVPKKSLEGVELKLYSGSLAGISSPVKNHVPVIIADIRMEPDASYAFNLPASYSTFLYVLDGNLQIGEERKPLGQNQVGWLDRSALDGDSKLDLSAGKSGARFVLYSGQPQGEPIVSHGPFIADTQEDISRLYREFRAGKMKHISTVDETQKFNW